MILSKNSNIYHSESIPVFIHLNGLSIPLVPFPRLPLKWFCYKKERY
jgi:hypothetical protein